MLDEPLTHWLDTPLEQPVNSPEWQPWPVGQAGKRRVAGVRH